MYKTESHVNEKHRNKTLLWHSYDNEDQFRKNISNEHIKWSLTETIEYKFNSYGFRSDEFRDTKNLISLGCSFTMGMGIPYESTWSYIVSKQLNLANFNLAIDGASADCCFRMAINWISQLKPKIVLYQNPNIERLEIFNTEDVPDNILPSSVDDRNIDLYRQWSSNDKNFEMNYFKNLYAIQYLCESINVKFIHIPLKQITRLDYARDIGHYGPKTHQAVAERILRLLDE